jgi:hypothetical protein
MPSALFDPQMPVSGQPAVAVTTTQPSLTASPIAIRPCSLNQIECDRTASSAESAGMRTLAGSARIVTAGPQKRMPCHSGLTRSSIRVISWRPTASSASVTSVVRKYLNFLASS